LLSFDLRVYGVDEFTDFSSIFRIGTREVLDGSLLNEWLGIAEMRRNVVTKTEFLILIQDIVEENSNLGKIVLVPRIPPGHIPGDICYVIKKFPFDLTKVWPHSEFPLHPVGKLTLNRNPRNYFAEVEQLAFSPAHLVPGIEPSPDKMLQGRLFSYNDTHRHRLGANYNQIPVNCPYRAKTRNYQRDGPMTVTNNQAGAPNFCPNSFSGPVDNRKYLDHVTNISGDVARWNSRDEDNFTQVGIFYNKVLNEEEKFRLCDNIASHLCNAQPFIQERAIKNFSSADPKYGGKIRELIDTVYSKSKNSQPQANL
jgi:catalase